MVKLAFFLVFFCARFGTVQFATVFSAICNSVITCNEIVICNEMPPRIPRQRPARRYARNSNEKRQSLIRLVIDEGLELRVAARQLDLKPSTARNILKKFNEKGDMEATRKKSNGVPPKLTAR